MLLRQPTPAKAVLFLLLSLIPLWYGGQATRAAQTRYQAAAAAPTVTYVVIGKRTLRTGRTKAPRTTHLLQLQLDGAQASVPATLELPVSASVYRDGNVGDHWPARAFAGSALFDPARTGIGRQRRIYMWVLALVFALVGCEVLVSALRRRD